MKLFPPHARLTVLAPVGVLSFLSAFAVAQSTWNQTAAGTYSWGTNANWTGGVPDGTSNTANLQGNLAAQVITLDKPSGTGARVLGFLNINSSQNFTISAGTGGVIRFQQSAATPGELNVTGGSGTHLISAAINLRENLNITNSGTGSLTLSGVIDDDGATATRGLSHAGTGTTTISGANSYRSSTTVSGGTLVLGNSGVIPDGSAVTLSGGTLRQQDFTETAGTLNVSAASTLDMAGTTGALSFSGTTGVWGGALQVWNWGGAAEQSGRSERLFFSTLTGFTADTVYNSIQFYSGGGSSAIGSGGKFVAVTGGFELIPSGLTPVPEPSALLGGLLLLSPVAWRGRRRWMRCREAVRAIR